MEENKSYDECVNIIEHSIRALIQQQMHDLMDLTPHDSRDVANKCAAQFRETMNEDTGDLIIC